MDHTAYSELSSDDRQTVSKLASILRIAEAIDREHSGRVKSLQVKSKKSKVELELTGDGDLLLEKWAIKSRAGLFENLFDVKFQLAD